MRTADEIYEGVVLESGIFDECRARFPARRKVLGFPVYDADLAIEAAEWAVDELLDRGLVTQEEYDTHATALVDNIANGLS
jgi:hypothetical protein